MVIPPPPIGASNQPSFTSTTLVLNAADEGAAFIVEAPKTGNIRKVLWGTRTVTTGATIDVRIETITDAGPPSTPSGTLWAANTNGAQVVQDADDNTGFATTLTADAAVTKGQALAVVIKNPNASFGDMQITAFGDDITGVCFPYTLLNTGVSPAVSWALASAAPVLAFEYDDGSYEVAPGCWPIYTTLTATSISTATTPDSVGTRFQFPYPVRATGCWLWLDADGDYVVKLVSTAYHQANGTGILATTGTIDSQLRGSNNVLIQWRQFAAAVELAADTDYRLVVEGTSATGLSVYDFDVVSAAALDAFWGGAEFHLTTAKDPTADGDWTNYNSGTFRKFIGGLVLDGFDDGVGAGGGVIAPANISGGIFQ